MPELEPTLELALAVALTLALSLTLTLTLTLTLILSLIRYDFVIDRRGQPRLLEVNSGPNMHPSSAGQV